METGKKRKPANYWNNYENVYNAAKECGSIHEFIEKYRSAYDKARELGILNTFTWLGMKNKPRNYWTVERLTEESKKYHTRAEFRKGNETAYGKASRLGLLDTFTWLRDARLNWNDGIEYIYAYEFEDYSVYVGLTMNPERRHKQHMNGIHKSAVYDYSKLTGLEIPKQIILESGLTIEQAQKKENEWVKKYSEKGYFILNTGKTGVGSSSIGAVGLNRWTKDRLRAFIEDNDIHGRGELHLKSSGACRALYLHPEWLDELLPYVNRWEYKEIETIVIENGIKTRNQLRKFNINAYGSAWKNGWLERLFPDAKLQKPKNYWDNFDNMKAEKLYKACFHDGFSGPYEIKEWNDTGTFSLRDSIVSAVIHEFKSQIRKREPEKYEIFYVTI